MRNMVGVVGLMLILSFSSNVSAKEKERAWQTGKVLDTSSSRVFTGTVDRASGSATTYGNSTYGNASGDSRAVYRVYETYTIDAGDYFYVCQEHIKWRWSKPAVLTINGPVQFAIEKNHVYIKSEDGSEHETTIIKTVAEPQQLAAPSAHQKESAAASPILLEKGTVTVSSTPSGADVYADGAFVGNAPAVLKLSEGKHTIKVSMSGFADWSRDISVLGSSEVGLAATLIKSN